jgi:hypothetical protein
MLYIYRPYDDNLKTAECLHENDCHTMKLNAFIILDQMLGKLTGKTTVKCYTTDPFFLYYWNNGKPYYDFMFDYYYSVYHVCTQQGGDMEDYAKGFESQYIKLCPENKLIPVWHVNVHDQHKMHLLKRDWFWYKRHFRDLYEYEIPDYSLMKGDEPVSIDRRMLKLK